MTWLLIKLLIRFVVFGVVFGVFSHKSANIQIKPKYAIPLVALVFALLNAGLYWLLAPVLNLATLGMASLFMPFIINTGFLLVTTRVLRKLRVDVKIDGILTILWLAFLLTVAHGALYVGLEMFA